MKSVLFALFSVLVLSSCTASKMAGLREGQTRAEVLSVAGPPDGYQRSGEYEVLLYIDRRTSAWSYFSGGIQDLVDYSVILKDDQVVEYGPGRTHRRDPNPTPFVRVPGR
jgi:hypothetical protein